MTCSSELRLTKRLADEIEFWLIKGRKHPRAQDGTRFHEPKVPMKKASTWAALKNPTFRKLWVASLVSGTCVAAHDTAATWTMNMVTSSPLFLSLMSTVASLPFFLFTLPAGALADMVDRKRLMYVMNVWLAA